MIAIVDYGMGNLRSVAKAIEHVAPKETGTITSDAAAIRAAERVVFSGQGAMPDCMRYLGEYGLEEAVRDAAASKPLLAVCIGEPETAVRQFLRAIGMQFDVESVWWTARRGKLTDRRIRLQDHLAVHPRIERQHDAAAISADAREHV